MYNLNLHLKEKKFRKNNNDNNNYNNNDNNNNNNKTDFKNFTISHILKLFCIEVEKI
jgi:hypothetical protein